MFTVSFSHVGVTSDENHVNVDTYKHLVKSIKLEPKNWPKSNDGEVDIQYGDKEIRQLCNRFHLGDCEQQIIRGFRTYKINENDKIPDDLKSLLKQSNQRM